MHTSSCRGEVLLPRAQLKRINKNTKANRCFRTREARAAGTMRNLEPSLVAKGGALGVCELQAFSFRGSSRKLRSRQWWLSRVSARERCGLGECESPHRAALATLRRHRRGRGLSAGEMTRQALRGVFRHRRRGNKVDDLALREKLGTTAGVSAVGDGVQVSRAGRHAKLLAVRRWPRGAVTPLHRAQATVYFSSSMATQHKAKDFREKATRWVSKRRGVHRVVAILSRGCRRLSEGAG